MKEPNIQTRSEAESFAPIVKKPKNRTPLAWYGGKVRLAPELIKLMPRHRIYVEVFGGGGAVLFAKPPSFVEVYNDLNDDVVNFFRTLRGRRGDDLIQQLALTPHARTEHAQCKRRHGLVEDDVERARSFYVLVRQSYAQLFANGYSTSSAHQAICRTWKSKVDALSLAVNRLRSVQIENLDFEKLIKKYDSPETLFYCDPPYLHDVRSSDHKYVEEMNLDDHERLLRNIRRVQGQVMLSGYDSVLYRMALKGWEKWSKTAQMACSANRKGRSVNRTEVIWMNFRNQRRQNR